eukprot:TRINITY_DN71832_c0_g1_i1.p1 TRINITY_DN71832_c0_g1~~TRINITY_DN71832_c0_g1_i1.p1  ORF type:complete len:565 (+),score=45.25 TRINITY_DN71832_c0_g1_i1:722-2416(+)
MFMGIFACLKMKGGEYQPLPPAYALKETPKKRNSLSRVLMVVAYLAISLLVRSEATIEPDLLTNPMTTLAIEYVDYLDHRCVEARAEIIADKAHLTWFQYCNTVDEFIKQYRSPVQTCFPDTQYDTNFTFIKRTKESPIKNVAIFFLESVRAGVMPFNYSSQFAKKLTKDTLNKKDLTPFMAKIAEKARYTTRGRSVSSFTIKTLIAALCSNYPFPKNFSPEYNYMFYHTCLPKLLKEYGGMSNAYVQPLLSDFYNHRQILKKKGFDVIYDAERMAKGEFGPPPKKFVNPLGYEDLPFRRLINNWVHEQQAIKKPFLLVYAASITHAFFETPEDWEIRLHSEESPIVNQYLNAVRYLDFFLEGVMEDFRKQEAMNNTLFIFMGDHGISLGEHDMWYTTDIPYETQFDIPILFYSENEEWNKRFPPGRFDKAWSNLDILPTILDALRFDGTDRKFTENYLYEGQSVLREKYESRVQLSVTNPGMTNIVLKEGPRKVVLAGIGWRKDEVYDLDKDPEETKSLIYEQLPLDFRKWVDEMKFARAIYIKKVKEWYQKAFVEYMKKNKN